MTLSWLRLLSVLASLWLLQACSLFNVSSASYYRDGEGRFNTDVFDSIEPNATTNTWLKQHFGQPFWVDKADHNVAINTWQFARERHKRKDVLLVLRYRSVREDVEYLHVVTQNNVVIKHWLDRYASVDVDRVIYALGLEVAPKQMPKEASVEALEPPPSVQQPSDQQQPMKQQSKPSMAALPVDGGMPTLHEPAEASRAMLESEARPQEITLPEVPEPVQAMSVPRGTLEVSSDSEPGVNTNSDPVTDTSTATDVVPEAPVVSVEATADAPTETNDSQNLYGI